MLQSVRAWSRKWCHTPFANSSNTENRGAFNVAFDNYVADEFFKCFMREHFWMLSTVGCYRKRISKEQWSAPCFLFSLFLFIKTGHNSAFSKNEPRFWEYAIVSWRSREWLKTEACGVPNCSKENSAKKEDAHLQRIYSENKKDKKHDNTTPTDRNRIHSKAANIASEGKKACCQYPPSSSPPGK